MSGASVKPTTSSSKQGEEKEKAPVVSFGMDLYYWGEEQPTAGKIIKYSDNSCAPITELGECFSCLFLHFLLIMFIGQFKVFPPRIVVWPLESSVVCSSSFKTLGFF